MRDDGAVGYVHKELEGRRHNNSYDNIDVENIYFRNVT